MKRILITTLLCAVVRGASAADTDGDGLLDLIDVVGFDATTEGAVSFDDRGIEDLNGASLLTKASILYFHRNRIRSIEHGDFRGLSKLWHLSFIENEITRIERGGFDGLSNLEGLILNKNAITNIDSGDFDGLSKLVQLGLNDNEIASIESGDFDGLSNLRTLDLTWNEITSIERGDFDGLTQLTSLYLSANQISTIESGAFDGPSHLSWLSLYGNQLTRIERGDFDGLTQLKTLYLGGNQISTVESDDFDGLSDLSLLYLGENPITSIESGAFRGLNHLSSLYLGGLDELTELNLSGATFEALIPCESTPFGDFGFCIESDVVTSLKLDGAVLSASSFQAIIGETTSVSDVSLVGLSFSDTSPADLNNLLTIAILKNVRVDQALFDRYAAEFRAFDAISGNAVSVVPEPSTTSFVLAGVLLLVAACPHSKLAPRN